MFSRRYSGESEKFEVKSAGAAGVARKPLRKRATQGKARAFACEVEDAAARTSKYRLKTALAVRFSVDQIPR